MTDYHPPTALPQHVLDRTDMRAAITAHDFGKVFFLARKWGQISYSKIAAECDIKPERVGALAKGIGAITTFEKIAQIADALRIPGHLLQLAPRAWEVHSGYPATPVRITAAHQAGDQNVLRRDFVKTTAIGAGLVLGLPGLTHIDSGCRIGPELPDRLRERAARLRRLDDVLGGGDTYRVYLGEYQATKAMIRDGSYTEATGKALLSVLAEQAQQAGWAAFDAGHQADARGLYEESHKAAGQAEDAPLAGNALAFLAYQTIGADPRSAVVTATESCHTAGPDAPAGVRTLPYERLAWAHAVNGNAAETERALGVAEAALAELDGTPQPDWVSWVDHNELQIMTGRCWTELRRPLRAVPALEHVLAGFDDTHARDKALYSCWLADSYLSAGEIEQAAAVTSRVLDLSAGVASVRPRERIAPVLRQLSPHCGLPHVAEVLEKARA
ncbi:XRE family transcriptional regulator [Streptacidiphilus sp. PB12-B1b]|uniref:XRE family transcriptional regulator n=1 Tax=Streptacidiphilus sp. PB12-B1b TaxID=2705012 RepID=UPI0015F82885|nr:XRE family transcriptional regulator [Streptacidiphilus sp. PB12-B1b]QMU75101.1 XRE family transcriptional regulator [Streptacidiphilus sp. PB12-B1b]